MLRNIFGKKRQSEDEDNEEDDFEERPKSKKSMFGFQCSPTIHMSAKVLAKQLNVDLYAVAEHGLQLGLMDIAAAAKDPEEKETLLVHLNKEHVLEHLVVSVSAYDAEAAEYIREGQSLLHEKERAMRDLVELSMSYRLDPLLIREIVLRELKRRRDIMRSQSAQKD